VKRAAAVLALMLAACGGDSTDPTPLPSPGASCEAPPVVGTPQLTTVRVASGLSSPLDVQAIPGDRSRLFVVEQGGRIRVVREGAVLPAAYLDIASRISSGGERGLLGLAFHPAFAQNGRFFVNYTDGNGDTHIAEFRAAPGADVADPNSERQILFVGQPFANHNGGGLAFGNDGMLYIGLGDGGSGGDPLGNAQNLATPLGKMLRIDVDRGSPFAVPPDNPFVARAGAFPAVWAYGLRNPWRFAFDRLTGDLVIGDVGQNTLEEVDVGLASRRGGENYGWNTTEGTLCFNPPSGCATAGLTPPVLDYATGSGGTCAVTGGYVYRGSRYASLKGAYFYGDYCSGRIWAMDAAAAIGGTLRVKQALDTSLSISSFGEDQSGEIYVVNLNGTISKLRTA